MSTLESTVQMIGLLSEDNLIIVRDFAKNILDSQQNYLSGNITKKQFLEELEISRQQAEQGQYSNARDVLKNMRVKYGII